MWKPGKPSENENEYFARRDAEWLRERRAKLDAERAVKERTHPPLECPRCHAELIERDFHKMKFDVCGACHGVWFDAGELELIMHVPRDELLRLVSDVRTQ